jgi:hypothetical protein
LFNSLVFFAFIISNSDVSGILTIPRFFMVHLSIASDVHILFFSFSNFSHFKSGNTEIMSAKLD